MLVSRVCLQEQRKQRFPTLAKENQSSLGFYRNPPTFFFINPRFVLLIRDQYSVLFSSLVCYYSRNANVLSHPLERLPHMTDTGSERKV